MPSVAHYVHHFPTFNRTNSHKMSEPEFDGRLSRKPLLIMLMSVDAFNLYLSTRQMEFILRNGLPRVLEGSISPQGYDDIRLRAAISALTDIIVIYYRMYSHASKFSSGTPTALWKSTSIARNPEFRVILWAFIWNIMENYVLVLILIYVSMVRKGDGKPSIYQAVITGVGWLMVNALGEAIKTFILIKATNKYGSKSVIYLSVLRQTITILTTVMLVLIYAPLTYQKMPEGPHKVEIDAVAVKAGQFEFILRNSTVPAVIASSVSQNDYDTIRVATAFSILVSILSIYVRLYTHSSSISDGAPTVLWRNTGEMTRNNEFRAILWATVDDFLSKLIIVPVVVVLSIFNKGIKQSPLAVALAGVAWLTGSALVTAIRTVVLIKATNKYGSRFFVYLSVLSETIIILGHVVFIHFMAPLVMSKLPEGPTKARIDEIAEKAGYYPKHGVYLEPTRDEVEQPNAYHAGILGTSMIVVSESLMKIVSPRDIAAVVAHELGHWNGSHSVYGFLANLIANVTFTIAAMWSFGNDDFFALLKFDPADPPHPVLGVLLFSKYFYPSIGNVIVGTKHTVGYFCEYAADTYAFRMGLGKELSVSLIRLFEKVLHFPHGDPWYTAWANAHPSIVRRIEHIDGLKPDS